MAGCGMSEFRHISEILPGIISHLGKGKEKGTEFVCHCPFHEDRTPSFSLNVEKGVYYCFGCGVSGGLNQLASKLGISAAVPYRPSLKKSFKPKKIQPWQRAKRINESFDVLEDTYKEAFRKDRKTIEEEWNEGLIPEVDYYTKREILKSKFDFDIEIHDRVRNRLTWAAKHDN